jgi:hypothetical protein
MSLINEALKKAQRQRTLDAAPLSAAPSAVAAAALTTHVRAASHRHRSDSPLWFAFGFLLLGVVSTVVVMRYGFPSAAPEVVAYPRPQPPALPSPPQTVISATAPVVFNPPVATYPNSAAPLSTPLPASSSGTTITVPVLPVVPPVASNSRPTHEAQVQAFLSTARLSGVRGVEAKARVLMNEKIYALDDLVEPTLGLRISAVRPGLLVFTDRQGRTYEKTY